MSWPLIYSAVAATAMAVLILELSLTRLFSVVFYYHFAFLAISIALFGLGAGGIVSYLVAAPKPKLFTRLGALSLIASALVLTGLVVILRPDPDPDTRALALIYAATALPFVAAGAILSLALAETVARVDRVYFADLAGAAAGCLLLVPLLNYLGAPGAVLAVAALFALTGAFWFRLGGSNRAAAAAGLAAIALSVFLAVNQQRHFLDVTVAKGGRIAHELFVRWNSFSRIAVRQEPGWGGAAIFIDADANTVIAPPDPRDWPAEDRRNWLRSNITAAAHWLRPSGKKLIIGPGGGMDVLHAWAGGSRDITGVEINPIIVNDVMRGRFAHMSGDLYNWPGIRVVVEDGRAYVRRSPDRYSVIQATLVDTWASTAAGAFALSENNLYTVEAFRDYLSHLTDDGLLTFTRWGFEPPRESLRLLALARTALNDLGEREPQRHVVILRQGAARELAGIGAQDTVILSRKPFSEADLTRIREYLGDPRYQAVYLPGQPAKNAFHDFLHAASTDSFLRDYPYDVSPVSDDRPFFFYTVQPRDLRAFLSTESANADVKINRAVPMLFGVVGISVAATLLVLVLPPLVFRARLPRRPGIPSFLLYFFAIGAGYILIEVALVQKFVLFLGHPTYALTVVIFVLLLSSGAGSRLSGRLSSPPWLVAVAAAATSLVAAWLLPAGVGWPLWIKCLATVLLLAPLGFVMGTPFPAGLKRLESWHEPSIRWAWALNAASSVLGAAGAIFSAIHIGLANTLFAGAFLYVAAWLIRRRADARFGVVPFGA